MKRNKIKLMDCIENSDLSVRSRIDLKKEVHDGKIRNMEELTNRMNQIKENPMQKDPQSGSNPSQHLLEDILAKSKLKKSYKNHYLKKIKNGEITDKEELEEEIEKDENKLYLLSTLDQFKLKDFSKNKIKKLINNNTVSDYKALRQEIKKESKEENRIYKIKKDREMRGKENLNKKNLISKLHKIELNDSLKMELSEEIKKGLIKNEEELNKRTGEIQRKNTLRSRNIMKKNRRNKSKKPQPKIELRKDDYSEDYRYYKDLYG